MNKSSMVCGVTALVSVSLGVAFVSARDPVKTPAPPRSVRTVEQPQPIDIEEVEAAPLASPLREAGASYSLHVDSTLADSDLIAEEAESGVRYVLTHEGASYVAVHFAELDLDHGDIVIVSDALGDQSVELTDLDLPETGELWTPQVNGDTMIIELVSATDRRGGFRIDKYAAGLPKPGIAEPMRWCHYPAPKERAMPGQVALINLGEVEPNSTPATAQVIPFGSGGGQDRDLNITGFITPNTDLDYFRLTATKGDVLGLAVIAGGAPDSMVAVTDLAGVVFTENDDHQGQAGYYPTGSPLPGGVNSLDSTMAWIVPANGDYLIRVKSFNGTSGGDYTLQIRGPRPGFEQKAPPATQVIFVDFNGASINAPALFGSGNNPANLSPLSSYMTRWGLTAGDENAVIDSILATVNENFDDLRTAALNGNRDTDGINGHMDVDVRNSRDHADPFGQPNVSRLIVGGDIAQLGISTIGIAEDIDPGNFGGEATAVILLDLMSAASPDPNSINSIPRAASFTKIQAIGRIVGNVTSHEAGHYLGNWHTLNSNATRSIMDAGGNLPINMGGVGADGTLGTADDQDVDFSIDAYGGLHTGNERTNVRTAFALATGAAGGCSGNPQCDDGLFCNGAEICNAGSCQAGTPPNCADAVACTTDSCNEGTDSCDHTPNNGACSDGQFCNGSETCNVTLGCQAGTPPNCADAVACTTDSCNEATDSCDHTPNNGACSDGQFCNGSETCHVTLGCQAGTPPNCSDGVACTDDSCNEGTDSCDHVANNANCNDGLFCTGAETCNATLGCQAGGDPCPGQICDEGTDTCANCIVDGDCSDGLFCNGTETCNAGSCQAGTPVNCDDGIACTSDSCNEGTDSCNNTPNNAACDDGLFCNGAETCNVTLGCQAGSDPCGGAGCDEGNDVCLGGPEIWMAFKTAATIPGVGTVQNEDIVAYNPAGGTWSLIFDGSDVGLSGFVIDGMAVQANGDILLSFTASGTVAGLIGGPGGSTTVDDSDIVRFTPTTLGSVTAGTLTFHFDGSDVGLTTDDEDIDAITLDSAGKLVISTLGPFSVTGLSGQDEDLIVFTATSLGSVTAGTYAMYFDGSDVGLSNGAGEDVDGAGRRSNGTILLSTEGVFSVPLVSGDNEDIIQFTPTSLGSTTAGNYSMFLDLSAIGIDPTEDVGALEEVE